MRRKRLNESKTLAEGLINTRELKFRDSKERGNR